MDYRKEMMALSDKGNAEFMAKLTPGDFKMLGARMPNLRLLAKKIAKDDWKGYLDSWKNEYFEDCMLRGLVIGYLRVDVEERLSLYEDFIPYIDNWAVCDSTCMTWKPKKKEMDPLWKFVKKYAKKKKEFEIRFAISMMIDNFITDDHVDEVISIMDSIRHDGYYVKMGVAWCISMCFVKFPEKTLDYLKGETNLDTWTYNKAIQKTIESYRVDKETKELLRSMKIRR